MISNIFFVSKIYISSWFKKKHHKTKEHVGFPPLLDEDELRSMTVVPYLVDLHFGEASDEENMEDGDRAYSDNVYPDIGKYIQT